MTRLTSESETQLQKDAIPSVSTDVTFPYNHFPSYNLGPKNQILDEPSPDPHGPSLKNILAEEATHLNQQIKRVSVRDLAAKFDRKLSAATRFSEETKLSHVASLEGHVLLKKLRDGLEDLRGCLDGPSREDAEMAISLVETLAVGLTRKEGELVQERFEVKKLVNFFKQTWEDAKRLVSQETSFACAELASARMVVLRFGEALAQQENLSQNSGNQEVKELLEEVQEARRIRLLHQPTKVLEMEHELRELRLRIREKAVFSVKLQKELVTTKRAEENRVSVFRLEGASTLGSRLRIHPRMNDAPDLSTCSIQWFRVSEDGNHKELIQWANKAAYAPEPFDIGKILQADISSSGQRISVSTSSPIDLVAGLSSYVQSLLRKSNSEFNVVISQMNGQDPPSRLVHVLQIGKARMKLSKGWMSKSRESYSTSMQLCGARGGGNIASKAVFWRPRKGFSFVLTFESEKDRNAAIIIARKYALDCNVVLSEPDDDLGK